MKHLPSSPEGRAPSTSAEAPVSGDCGSIPNNRGGDESPLPFALAKEDTASPVPLPVVKRSAKLNLSDEQKQKRRCEQNRKAKQRQRSKGDVKIEVTLTPMEWAEMCAMRDMQRGPLEGFFRRALITGAKFLANSGQSAQRKAKGNRICAASKPAIADMSAITQGGTSE